MFDRILKTLQSFDWFILLSVIILLLFGFSAIYSVELGRESGQFLLLRKQLIASGIGIGLFLLLINFHYLQWRNYARLVYVVGIVLLVLVVLFGEVFGGTKGWFDFGIFSFQPVEFMKFALVLTLARYFGEHARYYFGWKEIIQSGMIVGIPVVLILLQPDLGSAGMLVGIWGIYLLFAGMRVSHIATLLGVFALVFAISWGFLFADYQRDRVAVFLRPGLDPLDRGYNLIQAKIAIGSGQLFGKGLGFGSQSQLKFLPESHTDFVFAIIAEELGFIGVLVLFSALFLLLYRLLRLTSRARDGFTIFLLVGIFAAFFVQSFVIIGVNLSLLPATGVTLPFVSYGGSSLLVSFAFIGLAQSIVLRIRPGDGTDTSWYT